MNVLRIFGDSHVAQLQGACDAIGPALLSLPHPPSFNHSHGWNWVEFTLGTRNGRPHCHADRVPGSPALDFTLGPPEALHVFSSPLHSAVVHRDPAWRRFCPWDCAAANPELIGLSDATLESWFAALLACRWSLLRELRRQGYRLAVVEPPRPLQRVPAMYQLRREVVLAVDRRYRDHVRRWLAAEDIPVIAVPEQSVGADGFTTPEYANANPQDPHHGSLAFSAEMLRRILAFAGLA